MGKIPLKLEFVETKEHPEVVAELRRLFADTVIFYFKAHGCHWNVEGPDFGPLHTLFEGIATEVYGTIDIMAEHLRKLDEYAPTALGTILRNHTVSETQFDNGAPVPMLQDLYHANDALIAQIGRLYPLVEKAEFTALQNYLDERLDAHAKHGWFLRATLK